MRGEKLADRVSTSSMGLRQEAYEDLREHFEFMRWYVRGFRLTARGYCFGRYADEVDRDAILAEDKSAGELLRQTIEEMEEYREGLLKNDFILKYPYDAQLNPERVKFYTDALKRMSADAGLKGGRC